MPLSVQQFEKIRDGIRADDATLRQRWAGATVDVWSSASDEQRRAFLLALGHAVAVERVPRTREEQLYALSEAANIGEVPPEVVLQVASLDPASLTPPERESWIDVTNPDG